MKAIVGNGLRADWSYANQAWIIRPFNKQWPMEMQRKAPVLAIRQTRRDAEQFVLGGGSKMNPVKKPMSPIEAHRLGVTHTYDFLRSKIGTLAHNRAFTKKEFSEYVGALHQEGGPDKVLRDLLRWGLLKRDGTRYTPTKAGWDWIESALREYRNPLSNGETAFMIAAGAAALGALAYVFWPKSASAKTQPAPQPPLPPTPATFTVTENDDGKTINLRKGDVLVLKLDQQASTGYVWGFDLQGPAILAADLDGTQIADRSGVQTVTAPFTAMLPGQVKLRAILARGTTIGRTLQFNVVVQSAGIEV